MGVVSQSKASVPLNTRPSLRFHGLNSTQFIFVLTIMGIILENGDELVAIGGPLAFERFTTPKCLFLTTLVRLGLGSAALS